MLPNKAISSSTKNSHYWLILGLLLSVLVFGPATATTVSDAPRLGPPGPGQMIAKGHWYYHDSSATLQPLSNALVQLYDSNLNGEEFLGATFTQSNGYWEIGPFSSAGPDGKRHLLARVRTENAERGIWVKTPGGDTYYWQSATIDCELDGWVDFGLLKVPNSSANKPAVWVFLTLNQGWAYFPTNPGNITAVWAPTFDPPCGMCFDPRSNKILLASDAPSSPDAILHEFAHNVMFNVYGSWLPPVETACGDHWFTKASGPNCAWVEGWAEFFPLAVFPDNVFSYLGHYEIDLETPTWGTFDPIQQRPWDNGDRVEGRVAGALLDIFDTSNEGTDQISDNFGNIWDVVSHVRNIAFKEFWGSWKSRRHDASGALGAFYQNTIDYGHTLPPTVLDNATFIRDVTLPDESAVSPGQALAKTWRVRNSGTSTWDGYKLILLQGD